MELRNKTIYCIYVRNHSISGTFKAITQDLDRIKELGVDIIWFLPIHPIGKLNKKGTLGCPYSISDYRKVNPEYGTLEDFIELIEEIHTRDMKAMIDVVYNHTSYDSVLLQEHPEYFYVKENGSLGNKAGEWSDVIDLDYSQNSLWDYQIETLKYWAELGVDGFRCDVASIVPIEFWRRAKEEIKKINKDFIWLAESSHPVFIQKMRKLGFFAHSDSELYQVFDINYDYEIHDYFLAYCEGKCSLETLLERKRAQEWMYPKNYLKLRFLENHDQPRAYKVIPSLSILKNFTAFMFFEKGVAQIYAGQEVLNKHTPSLFEKDLVDWSYENKEFYNFLKKLISIKKMDIIQKGYYEIISNGRNDVIEVRYTFKDKILIGLFNVGLKSGKYEFIFKNMTIYDGEYIDIITAEKFDIIDNSVELGLEPLIFEIRV